MKLRTSFFNVTVLRKNLTRFAPLWVLTTILEVLCLVTEGSIREDLAFSIAIYLSTMTILVMIYALVAASCVFGDLFNSRMCHGLHAMPMRREGWLLTNLASGFLFALIPSVVGGLVAAVLLKEYAWVALVWQTITMLQFVFFFGVAVFSAVCAGKRSGMMLIYLLINFLAMLIYWIADLFYRPLLPGVVLPLDTFSWFTPVNTMSNLEYIPNIYQKGLDYTVQIKDWNYLLICVGVGIVFLALSWLLYRKRHLETAGDFISFRPLKIVFLLAYTFAVCAFVRSVFGNWEEDGGNYGLVALGALIGWFTGWMLLERTVKVFNKKVILGFVAFGLLFGGSLALTAFDITDIANYVPANKAVESACIYTNADVYYYEYNHGGHYADEPEEIAQVAELHRGMIDIADETGGDSIYVYVKYQLKNGTVMTRGYHVPVESEIAEDLSRYFSDIQMMLHTNEDWEAMKANIESICIEWHDEYWGTSAFYTQEERMETILNALEADCLAGNMAQSGGFYNYETVGTIEINWKDDRSNRVDYLDIFAGCEHLIALRGM